MANGGNDARSCNPGSWLLLVAIAGLSFLLGALVALLVLPGAREILLSRTDVPDRAAVGGPFTLTDHTGRLVTERDFHGRYLLLTFSYTRSPDVGPAQLQLMAAVLGRLRNRAELVVPVLVTLDPARDTPADLAGYIARFHPRIVGLTGSEDEIAAMARAWHLPFERRPMGAQNGDYEIAHPALIYLMGPDGTYVAHFGPATGVEAMAARIGGLISQQ
jgi:cytochrome oxidase Cu insertion factor (SCO1/SenC/PrrC family)